MLEQRRPALGDGVVAEPPLLHRQIRPTCARSAPCGRPRGRARASRRGRRSAGSRASPCRAPRSARRTRAGSCSAAARRRDGRSPARAGRCRGRRASPRARAACGRPGSAGPSRARGRRAATSQRSRLVEPDADPRRGRAGRPISSHSVSVESSSARHCSASSSSSIAEAVVELEVARLAQLSEPPRAWTPARFEVDRVQVLVGQLVAHTARAARACRGRARSRSSAGASGRGSSRRRPRPRARLEASRCARWCSRVRLPR